MNSNFVMKRKPVNLKCEYENNPIGVCNRQPLLSWEIHENSRSGKQSAYQIIAADSIDDLEKQTALIWDTGKVSSSKSFAVQYSGKALYSSERIFWKVKIWDNNDEEYAWSDASFFEMGLLEESDWHGHFMGFLGGMIGNGQLYRYAFELKEKPKWSRVYICCAGYYQLHLNGHIYLEKRLDPSETDYSKTLLYSTYEAESYLKDGLNVIGVVLGTGWAGSPKFILQMNIRYSDGTQQEIFTDWGIGWNVARGPILANSIYDGEIYDARKEKKGWDTPEYQSVARMENQRPGGWILATMVEHPGGKFIGEIMPPVRPQKMIKPVSIKRISDNHFIYDFGINIAGWASIKVHGKAGSSISLKYFEVFDKNGSSDMSYYRTCLSTDKYILAGRSSESYEPIFTYHGFQYIEVVTEGILAIDDIEAVYAHSDVKDNSEFEINNDLLKKIQRAMKHTDACNLYGIPTDCCQRDERHGWATDTTARAEGSIYQFDMASFFDKWMHDILDSQSEDGYFADTAPFRWGRRPCDPQVNTPISLPLLLYEYYGNKRILEESFLPIHHYLQALLVESRNFMISRTGFGEWACPLSQCYIEVNEANATNKVIPPEFVSTAYLFVSIQQMERICNILGKKEENYYKTIGGYIKKQFNEKYYDKVHHYYTTNTQSANALAISLGLAPKENIAEIVKNIAADVARNDYHVTTGSMGTKAIFEVLSEYGEENTAYGIMANTSIPSFGYMIEHGASTIWERWEADQMDNVMNSRNQPMLGSAVTWFYKYLAGIRIGELYRSKIYIEPIVPDEVQHCSAEIGTMLGKVYSSWTNNHGKFELDVSLPFNSDAEIVLRDKLVGKSISISGTEQKFEHKEDRWVLKVGSGSYHITAE